MTLMLSWLVATATAQAQPAPEAGPAVMQSWSVAYGGYVGGTSGWLVGEAMETSEEAHTYQGAVPGVLVGAAAGGVTGYLMTRGTEVDLDKATLLWTGSGVGTFYGVQLGRAAIPIEADGAAERVHAAGLAGSMAGAGTAFLVKRAPSYKSQLHFDLATGIGSLAAGGVSDMAGLYLPEDQQARAGINLAGAATFGGIAAGYSRFADQTPNAGAWGLSLGHATWIGAMSPYLFTDTPSEREVLGGLRAGLGVGYAGALGMAAIGNPSPKSVALQSAGWAAGSALGAGLPLAIGGEGPAAMVVGPMLAGGAAGQALGAIVAPHYEATPDDAYLVGTVGAWTAYQTAGWAAYSTANHQRPSRAMGNALSTGGAGTLLAIGLAPALEVPASGSAMLLSAGGWGTWYGGWGAQVADAGPDDAWLAMLVAGDGALIGTAIAEGAGWKPTWRQVGIIDGMGLLGGAAGGLVGVIALYEEDNWDPMSASILVGSTVGLGAGAVLATRPSKGGVAMHAPEIRTGRTRWQPTLTARPWMDEAGQPGMYGEFKLQELGRVGSKPNG